MPASQARGAEALEKVGDWSGIHDLSLSAFKAGICSRCEHERLLVQTAVRERYKVKENKDGREKMSGYGDLSHESLGSCVLRAM